MKLRTFYFLLASSIVVPVALFCGMALNLLQEAQTGSAIGRIEQSASLTALMIDADIHRAQSVIKVLGNSHALADGDLAAFHQEALAANAGAGAWVILYDPSGQQIVNTRLPFGATLPKRPDPDQVTKMLASGKGQVTGIKYGVAVKSNFVMVETPIRSASGKPYVIGQAFSPQFFSHTFGAGSIPSSWRISILDQAGTVIARSNRADEFVGTKAGAMTLAEIGARRTGMFRHVNGAGDEVYDAYTRSRLSNWSIIVGAPVAEIDAAVRRGVTIIGVGLFIALVSALAMALRGLRSSCPSMARNSSLAAFCSSARVRAAFSRTNSSLRSLSAPARERISSCRRRLASRMASLSRSSSTMAERGRLATSPPRPSRLAPSDARLT
jgi:hypothetical protein